MSTVKAKFVVISVEPYNEGTENEKRNISLSAVVGNSEENAEWSKWTPSGTISMSITNPGAFEQFEAGKKYSVTFEKVEEVKDLTQTGGEVSNEGITAGPGHVNEAEINAPQAESGEKAITGSDVTPVDQENKEIKDENQQ